MRRRRVAGDAKVRSPGVDPPLSLILRKVCRERRQRARADYGMVAPSAGHPSRIYRLPRISAFRSLGSLVARRLEILRLTTISLASGRVASFGKVIAT